MKHDYIPHAYDALVIWMRNLLAYVVENSARLHIDNEQSVELEMNVSAFTALCIKADAPSASKVDRAERKAMYYSVDRFIRSFVNRNLRYNSNVTDYDRMEMGLNVRDTTYTPVPVPTTYPEFSIQVVASRRLLVRFHISGSKRKAKPYGTNGAVIAWSVSDAPVSSPEDLTKVELATRTPHTFEFSNVDRGRNVYFAICWQNRKGQRGPWSDVRWAIIP